MPPYPGKMLVLFDINWKYLRLTVEMRVEAQQLFTRQQELFKQMRQIDEANYKSALGNVTDQFEHIKFE